MIEGKHPLTAYREQHGLTQANLAKMLGVSRVALYRWESGRRFPEPSNVRFISQKTGIPPLELRPDLVELERVDTSNPPFAIPADKPEDGEVGDGNTEKATPA